MSLQTDFFDGAQRGARDILASAERDAIISRCTRFRYWLLRRWGPGHRLLFVMLNPSTADADVDVERCSDALLFRPDLIADIRAAIVRSAGPNWRAAL